MFSIKAERENSKRNDRQDMIDNDKAYEYVRTLS